MDNTVFGMKEEQVQEILPTVLGVLFSEKDITKAINKLFPKLGNKEKATIFLLWRAIQEEQSKNQVYLDIETMRVKIERLEKEFNLLRTDFQSVDSDVEFLMREFNDENEQGETEKKSRDFESDKYTQ